MPSSDWYLIPPPTKKDWAAPPFNVVLLRRARDQDPTTQARTSQLGFQLHWLPSLGHHPCWVFNSWVHSLPSFSLKGTLFLIASDFKEELNSSSFGVSDRVVNFFFLWIFILNFKSVHFIPEIIQIQIILVLQPVYKLTTGFQILLRFWMWIMSQV